MKNTNESFSKLKRWWRFLTCSRIANIKNFDVVAWVVATHGDDERRVLTRVQAVHGPDFDASLLKINLKSLQCHSKLKYKYVQHQELFLLENGTNIWHFES